MDTLLQDLRYALRTLWRSPGFALVAVVTLALGIGANAAVFSLVNAVFLRPLPGVTETDRLVRIYGGDRGEPASSPISYPDYLDLAARAGGVFTGVAAAGGLPTTRDGDLPVASRVVSGNYFQVLGVRPALGRPLSPADDQPAARPVVVVSHLFWTRELGGAADVLGTELRLNGRVFTIVGVAPEGFFGTEVDPMTEAWVPLSQTPLLRGGSESRHGSLDDRGSHWVFPIARLASGATREQSAALLTAVARQLAQEHPELHEDFRMRDFPGGTLVTASGAPEVVLVFTILMVVVGAVLCVACANVANLLLARAAARRREIAVRLSLGAARGRLVRQLLTESLVLAAAGGVAGLGLAQLAPMLFRTLELPASLDLSTDYRVLLFAAAVTFATGLLFGLTPALQSVREGTADALKDGSSRDGRTGSRLRSVLTVTQMALSLTLLVAAALLLRSLWALQSARVPYDESRVSISFLERSQAGTGESARRAGMRRLLEASRAVPGVEGAAIGSMVPMSDFRSEGDYTTAGSDAPRRLQVNLVSASYFDVLGLPVRAGRGIGEQDREGGAPVAVVSRAAAAALWPGRSPLGQTLRSTGEQPREYEVVGVVEDVVYARFAGVQPGVYLSWEQSGSAEGVLHLRTRPGATRLDERMAMAARGTGVSLFGVRSLSELRREAAFPQRLTGTLMSLFGGIALLMAAIGLYGVVAYGVAQRTREIGVRIALGARPGQVRGLVVRQGVRIAGIGVGVGLVIALGMAQALRTLLYGVGAADPLTFGGVSVLLLLVAAAASWIPARRAAALEPMRALRSE